MIHNIDSCDVLEDWLDVKAHVKNSRFLACYTWICMLYSLPCRVQQYLPLF